MGRRSDGHGRAEHRDRSAGLVVFGILEILIGGLLAALMPLTVAAMVLIGRVEGRDTSGELWGVLPGLVTYAVIGLAFVIIGIGSIRARRWARALILVLSWLWLVSGVVAIVVTPWFLRALWSQLGAAGGLQREVTIIPQVTTILFLGFVCVALPAAFVAFYRSPHVAATCRARDPGPSWVDDCPPHILSLALLFALAALSVLASPGFGFALPVFGTVLSGWAGAVGWALILALLVYLVRGTFRRDPVAWWVAMVGTVAAAVATTASVILIPIEKLLDELRLPPEQRALIDQMTPPGLQMLVVLSLVTWGSLLAYLVFVRRYFRPFPQGDSEQ
jgi:hypothetical protein